MPVLGPDTIEYRPGRAETITVTVGGSSRPSISRTESAKGPVADLVEEFDKLQAAYDGTGFAEAVLVADGVNGATHTLQGTLDPHRGAKRKGGDG